VKTNQTTGPVFPTYMET